VEDRSAGRLVAKFPRDVPLEFALRRHFLAVPDACTSSIEASELASGRRWRTSDRRTEVVAPTEYDAVLARFPHRHWSLVRNDLALRSPNPRDNLTGVRIRDLDIVRAIRPVIDDDADGAEWRTHSLEPAGDDFDLVTQVQHIRHAPRLAISNAHRLLKTKGHDQNGRGDRRCKAEYVSFPGLDWARLRSFAPGQ
jgi:hypothetical protein